MEELAYGDATLAVAAVVPSAFANAIVDHGSEEQKKKYLPLFCGADFHAASLAVVEGGAVFDALKPRTTAEPKGESFVLSGSKCFVPLGDRASHFLVVAANGDGLDAFIVPRDAAGLSISEPELNLGLRGLVTVSLDLERVEVPAADRLGGAEGCDVRNLLASSRAGLSAVMVGLSRGVLEECIPYAKDRVAFDEAIAKKQSIAFRMAEMHIETECMRWLTWKAASFVEQGIDAVRPARLARSYAAEKCLWIADNGMTPHILVEAGADGVDVPDQAIQKGKVILNIDNAAVRELDLGNAWLSFKARFSGSEHDVTVPIEAVLAIYAKENGQGMMFSLEDETIPPTDPDSDSKPAKRPHLKIVK